MSSSQTGKATGSHERRPPTVLITSVGQSIVRQAPLFNLLDDDLLPASPWINAGITCFDWVTGSSSALSLMTSTMINPCKPRSLVKSQTRSLRARSAIGARFWPIAASHDGQQSTAKSCNSQSAWRQTSTVDAQICQKVCTQKGVNTRVGHIK